MSRMFSMPNVQLLSDILDVLLPLVQCVRTFSKTQKLRLGTLVSMVSDTTGQKLNKEVGIRLKKCVCV